jgi:hypothetical protein
MASPLERSNQISGVPWRSAAKTFFYLSKARRSLMLGYIRRDPVFRFALSSTQWQHDLNTFSFLVRLANIL